MKEEDITKEWLEDNAQGVIAIGAGVFFFFAFVTYLIIN